jgi:hypothetical protein
VHCCHLVGPEPELSYNGGSFCLKKMLTLFYAFILNCAHKKECNNAHKKKSAQTQVAKFAQKKVQNLH